MPTPSRVSRRFRSLPLLCLAVALALAAAPSARALPASGELSLVGSLVLGSNAVDFAPAGGGSGSALVVEPSGGSFAGLAGTTAQVADLDVSAGQVGVPISVPSVLVLAAAPGLAFDLTFLEPGVFSAAACGSAAAGATCTPAGSAYQFVNVPTQGGVGSVLSFSVAGTVASGADLSTFVGTFTAQFQQPFSSVLATLGGGGTVASSYSAVFQVVPVPEPATLACLGLGLALLGRLRPARH